eukprot:2504885-Amphidinium_carterae.1
MHWFKSTVAQQWKRVHTCTLGTPVTTIQVTTRKKDNCTFIFRMVAEPRFTMRKGPGALEDRETAVLEYSEEMREIDNVYRMDDE